MYFTIGNNLNYIKLFDLCYKSLQKQNYNGDILIITNYEDEIKKLIDLKSNVHFMKVNPTDLLRSSSNKLQIFNYININNYDKIIYCDCDVIWTGNPKDCFNYCNWEKINISNENNLLLHHEYYGQALLSNEEKIDVDEKKILGMSAGIFMFDCKLIKHIANISNFFENNIEKVNCILEQPYINVYLYRNNLYDTKITAAINHNGYSIKEKNKSIVLHFPGGPGNFSQKFITMQNYYNNFMD